MKYKCPACNNVFEGQLPNCPHCGKAFYYPNQVKETPKKKGSPFKAVAIVSIVLSVLTMSLYPVLLLNLTEFGSGLLETMFTTLIPQIWEGMVRELFTFFAFIFIVIFLVIGAFVLMIAIFALGPIGFIVAFILSLIAIIRTRRWYAILALVLAIINILVDVGVILWLFNH